VHGLAERLLAGARQGLVRVEQLAAGDAADAVGHGLAVAQREGAVIGGIHVRVIPAARAG
jgi:hypothetical protein